MRPSALKTAQRYEDALRGFWVLIPVILALFLFRTIGINDASVTACSSGDVFVQIDGDIKYPGVYSFDNQADIRELIELGGGIKSVTRATIDLSDIPIHSGSKITVQRDHDSCTIIHGEISSFHKITLDMPVSINTESEDGLTAVPGIGPGLAKSIVKARTEKGGFKTLEELRSVHGIGDKTYNKIITHVTL